MIKRIKMTNAEFAILSLIVEQPRHGYEIEQVIEERGMRNWTEVGFSSIYYILNKLEIQFISEICDGFIIVSDQQGKAYNFLRHLKGFAT